MFGDLGEDLNPRPKHKPNEARGRIFLIAYVLTIFTMIGVFLYYGLVPSSTFITEEVDSNRAGELVDEEITDPSMSNVECPCDDVTNWYDSFYDMSSDDLLVMLNLTSLEEQCLLITDEDGDPVPESYCSSIAASHSILNKFFYSTAPSVLETDDEFESAARTALVNACYLYAGNLVDIATNTLPIDQSTAIQNDLDWTDSCQVQGYEAEWEDFQKYNDVFTERCYPVICTYSQSSDWLDAAISASAYFATVAALFIAVGAFYYRSVILKSTAKHEVDSSLNADDDEASGNASKSPDGQLNSEERSIELPNSGTRLIN